MANNKYNNIMLKFGNIYRLCDIGYILMPLNINKY